MHSRLSVSQKLSRGSLRFAFTIKIATSHVRLFADAHSMRVEPEIFISKENGLQSMSAVVDACTSETEL